MRPTDVHSFVHIVFDFCRTTHTRSLYTLIAQHHHTPPPHISLESTQTGTAFQELFNCARRTSMTTTWLCRAKPTPDRMSCTTRACSCECVCAHVRMKCSWRGLGFVLRCVCVCYCGGGDARAVSNKPLSTIHMMMACVRACGNKSLIHAT